MRHSDSRTERADRRSARTRRLLGTALLELLHERGYDDITVQDILDRANIGRSTFYAHYYDKDDLLTSELARVIDLLSGPLATGSSDSTIGFPSRALFAHVYDEPTPALSAQRSRLAAELQDEGLRS